MTGAQLLELGQSAREAVNADVARWRERASLADSYVRCAADQLDQGAYVHAIQLCRRAGEICSSYTALHTALSTGGAQ